MYKTNLPITLPREEYDEEYFEIKSFHEEGIKDNIQYAKDTKYYYADNMVFPLDMYLHANFFAIKENLSGLTQSGKEYFEQRFNEKKDNSLYGPEELCQAPYTHRNDDNKGVHKDHYKISRTLIGLRIVPLKLKGFIVYKGVDVIKTGSCEVFNNTYVLQKIIKDRRIFELPCYEQYNNGIAMVLYEAYKQNIIQPIAISSPYQILVQIEKVLRDADFPLEEEYTYDWKNKRETNGCNFQHVTLVDKTDIVTKQNKIIFNEKINKKWKVIRDFMALIIETNLESLSKEDIKLLKNKYSKNLQMDTSKKENIIRVYLYEQVKYILNNI